ncbi:AAA ATPase domain-containing protein [Geodermatophilus obscurus]|uniref:AAA ATPase domain-containing protein n=1 Tax=Geodermatophilus obscurus TaxID=1861 RepID=A0A1I5CPY5_9ACTN|nr:ATP-binding protein [Geodermatophilus obscurus]SFN88987.1 AAA ATPase domain-containing protein [Geodermatophilus obscurus]
MPCDDYEFSAFEDLYQFLRWQADPDRRVVDEAELTARVGDWIGEHVLGPEVMGALLGEAPVTVRVPVPAQLGFLPYRPWEIASWKGEVLGREQVRFVFDLPDTWAGAHELQSERRVLRVLALFSLPTGGAVLGLRRERYALDRLIQQLRQGPQARAVQLRVLQYGVTQEALSAAVDDGDGWDILHISGYSDAGKLVLETSTGARDPIAPDELVALVKPTRRRLKLAVLSPCESGASTAAESLHLLDLALQTEKPDNPYPGQTPPSVQAADVGAGAHVSPHEGPTNGGTGNDAVQAGNGVAGWPGLDQALVQQLGCAVLAMRYPVIDDFAIELTGQLYRGLFERGHSVDVALARALPRAASNRPSLGAPAVSLATPALLGPATGLKLQPPPGPAAPISIKMAGFPDEPARFVGRTATLTRARHALMPGSERTGVLLHGIAGAGKSTAATELAYQTAGTFAAAAWWTAPPADQWTSALASLALLLESRLNRFLDPDHRADRPMLQLVGNTATDALLESRLPDLAEVIEQARLLIVLDNLENLLSKQATWLDPRFGQLITTLADHTGATRMVLTSRIIPAGLDLHRVDVLPIHTLSRDEALLLARELPHLHALQHDTEPAAGFTAPRVPTDRMLLARTLAVVQGHPELLRLADATAADPAVLETRVAAAEAAATQRGTPLAAFLATGESEANPDQLFEALTGWTRATAGALSEAARALLQLLAAAEPADRTGPVLDGSWAGLWHRLDRPGDPPPLAETLAQLTIAALAEPEQSGNDEDAHRPLHYALHPGVADAVRADTPAEILTAIDSELAQYWMKVFNKAKKQEGHEATGRTVARAALAATSYLLRLRDWDTAGPLLEQALDRDQTPATLAAVLPRLQAIADATVGSVHELEHQASLARAIAIIDPAEGERQLRSVLKKAVQQEQHRTAITIAGDLGALLGDRGRFPEALTAADQMAQLTESAGLGPWTRLANAVLRLQLRAYTDEADAVSNHFQELRDQLESLPDSPADTETVEPWSVREALLDIGRGAALASNRWRDALRLNAEIQDSERRRGAGPYELARTRFNDYGPLMRLGQAPLADEVLRDCQHQFEQARDAGALAAVLGARADLADEQGYSAATTHHAQVALRYLYAGSDPLTIASGHYKLAGHLGHVGAAPETRLAHRLTAALLHRLTGADHDLQRDLHSLAHDFTATAAAGALPATVEQLQATVEQIDGVHLANLLEALEPDPTLQQATLGELLDATRTINLDPAFDAERHVATWNRSRRLARHPQAG